MVQVQTELKGALSRFGHQEFRDNQERIIGAIMDGRDVSAVLPTGSGKSLLFMLPSTLSPGVTVVVSPLIALMHEQALKARDLGIPVWFAGRSGNDQQLVEDLRHMVSGEIRLLFISPERLMAPGTRLIVNRMGVDRWVFDEAHCLVEWGQDFRPDYLRAAEYVRLRQEPVVALTASATMEAQDAIEAALGMSDPIRVRGDVVRPNIGLVVTRRVDDGCRQIEMIIRAYRSVPGIIYRNLIVDVDRTVRALNEAGISAVPYHASMKAGERFANYHLWKNGKVYVVVATIAFGMGIDKTDVRYVIHGDTPRGLDDYYQQLGRAGRDGEEAMSVLLWDTRDLNVAMFHSWNARNLIAAGERVNKMADYLLMQGCRWSYLAAYYGQQIDKCCVCDNCRKETV